MLHDQENSFWGFNYFVDLNDVRMLYDFQNMNFSGNSLDVVNVIDLLFIQNLDRDFLAGEDMSPLFNLSKCSLTKGLLNFVVSDHFSSINYLCRMLDRQYYLSLVIRIRLLHQIFSFGLSCYRLQSREVSSLLPLRCLDVLDLLDLEINLRFVIYLTVLIVLINNKLLTLPVHLIVHVHFEVLLEKVNVLFIILKVLILLVLYSRRPQIYRFFYGLRLFTRDGLRPWDAVFSVGTVGPLLEMALGVVKIGQVGLSEVTRITLSSLLVERRLI